MNLLGWLRRRRSDAFLLVAAVCFGVGFGLHDAPAARWILFGVAAAFFVAILLVPAIPAARRRRARGRAPFQVPDAKGQWATLVIVAGLILAATNGFGVQVLAATGLALFCALVLAVAWAIPPRRGVSG